MGDEEEERAKGGKEIAALAEKGLALFAAQGEDEYEYDTAAAQKFKDEADAQKVALEAEAAALTGKDNAKARKEKSKQASEVQKTPEYLDALKVIKGQPPKNGNFAILKSAAKKDDAPKEEADAKKVALDAEAAALTGKDNAKARKEKSKEASEVTKTPEYLDALKVIKGQPPKNGNFAKLKSAAKAADAPKEEAKEEAKDDKKAGKEKPKKAIESAGISKAERDELEKLKNDIIARKKELKEGGMSGGQMNKDEQIVGWVTRMNELKEKENPGCLQAAKEEKKGGKKKVLSAEQEQAKKALEEEIEVYRGKLKGEFGYSNKDIKADPDLNDMLKRLAEMK